jgi:hypothetical protein
MIRNGSDNDISFIQQKRPYYSEDLSARLKKDWNASIAAFDKGLDHLMMLADVLSAGIIKQFPEKF